MVAIASSEVYDIVVHDRQLGASFRFVFDDGEIRQLRSIRFPFGTDLDAELLAREPDVLAHYIQSLKEDAAEVFRDRIVTRFEEIADRAFEGIDPTNQQMQTLKARLDDLAQHQRDNP